MKIELDFKPLKSYDLKKQTHFFWMGEVEYGYIGQTRGETAEMKIELSWVQYSKDESSADNMSVVVYSSGADDDLSKPIQEHGDYYYKLQIMDKASRLILTGNELVVSIEDFFKTCQALTAESNKLEEVDNG